MNQKIKLRLAVNKILNYKCTYWNLYKYIIENRL